jgi:hypothetical protein
MTAAISQKLVSFPDCGVTNYVIRFPRYFLPFPCYWALGKSIKNRQKAKLRRESMRGQSKAYFPFFPVFFPVMGQK